MRTKAASDELALAPFVMRGPRLHRAAAASLALLCLGAAFAFGTAPGKASSRGLVAELAREAASLPAAAPRLSISSGVRPCTAVPGASVSSGACVPTEAGAIRSRRIQDIGVRAAAGIAANADPGAMHAAALIDLLYDAAEGKTLQRSISFLQMASRLTDRPAPVLADLAAAYLVRAERARTPRDLLAAIEAAEQALGHEPRNPAALFNRALALHRFGVVEEAARDWGRYLAVDSSSAWAHAARRGLGEAVGVPIAAAAPGPRAPAAAYEAYAAAEPQGARVLGMCQLLGAWAQARLAGDAPSAEAHLRRAEMVARALLVRRGGDATLSDAARAIRGRSGPGQVRLARAHREFAVACSLDEQVEFRAAAPRFRAAYAEANGSPVLRAWARLMYGSMIFHTGDGPGGEAIFREIAGAADPLRHPALAGRARQLLAARLLRADRYDAGVQQGQAAAGLLRTAGERENEGAALEGLSAMYFELRDADAAYAAAHAALARLQPYRGSYRLHNVLCSTAMMGADDGFARAAVRIQDEGVRVAERTRNPVYVAEARLTRAQLLAARSGGHAVTDLAAARVAVASVADLRAREWMTAQMQLAGAAASLRTSPEDAARALDSASAFLLEMDAPVLAFPAVVGGAQARLATGQAAIASARLESALGILERRRESIRMESRRAAVFEAARGLVNRLVMLRLASGETVAALGYLDRGRASLAPVGAAPTGGEAGAVEGPPDEVALVYALVGDTLLVWTVRERRVELSRTVVDTLNLERSIDQLLRQLERPAGEEELRGALSQLYELLVRPVQARLGGPGTPLVVIADGSLASVPFAALHDTGRGRYLVEDHPLRFAVSLRDARRPPPRRDFGNDAVLVADPAFDAIRHAGFERLRGAAQEVRELTAEYPRARVLSDVSADRAALRSALGRAALLHYAGHAVFDDERPERSYLLLAPGAGGAGTLEAAEIAQMDLRHLSLVVLSACETVRTGTGRAAGFSGLAGAFLAAGAGGAVGSLWKVEDPLTRPLMVEFHRSYHATQNGPAALRSAQMRLLRSADPAFRSPAAWAGFRYAGS